MMRTIPTALILALTAGCQSPSAGIPTGSGGAGSGAGAVATESGAGTAAIGGQNTAGASGTGMPTGGGGSAPVGASGGASVAGASTTGSGGAPVAGASSGGAPGGAGESAGGSGGTSTGGAGGGAGGATAGGAPTGDGGGTAAPMGYARDPIVTHIFTADPSAEVFNGRVYIYGSHDPDDQMGYDMVDYHVFSSNDLVNWQDHGVALDSADISWTDRLYAPDACYSETTGKYYLYFPNSGSAIGVAESDDPGGPFVDAIGAPLISTSTPGVSDVDWLFDPTCFIDDDGQAYLYFGGGPDGTGDNARVIRLNQDMVSLADASATTIVVPDFFEASYVHKRDGKYYYSYSTSFLNHAAYIDYMMSDDPMTGFEYIGTILPSPAGNNGDNNHHSMIEYEGSWYIFYHSRVLANRLGGYSNYQRSMTLDHMTYAEDGTIVPVPAERGTVAQLRSVDAHARIEAESIAAEMGIETEFAEDNGTRVGVNVSDLNDQDWIGYSQLDFRAGATTFHARVASGATTEGSIEVRIDGCNDFTEVEGTVIGTCAVAPTGGWQTWADVSCPVTETSGVHDVCLRFIGSSETGLLNLDYFRFE